MVLVFLGVAPFGLLLLACSMVNVVAPFDIAPNHIHPLLHPMLIHTCYFQPFHKGHNNLQVPYAQGSMLPSNQDIVTLSKNSTILCAHIVQQSMCILNLQHHAYMLAYCTLQSHHHACHFVLLLMCSLVAQWHSPYRLVVGFQPELFFMLLSFLKHTHNMLDIGNWQKLAKNIVWSHIVNMRHVNPKRTEIPMANLSIMNNPNQTNRVIYQTHLQISTNHDQQLQHR